MNNEIVNGIVHYLTNPNNKQLSGDNRIKVDLAVTLSVKTSAGNVSVVPASFIKMNKSGPVWNRKIYFTSQYPKIQKVLNELSEFEFCYNWDTVEGMWANFIVPLEFFEQRQAY